MKVSNAIVQALNIRNNPNDELDVLTMKLILQIFGWFGLIASGSNAAIKLFADDATALRYAGPGRDLDLNISMVAFCLIFLGIAAILSRLDSR